MTITVASNTPVGTYPITVTGTGGGTQQSTTVKLDGYVGRGKLNRLRGAAVNYYVPQANQVTGEVITAPLGGGFNGAVTLTSSGLLL